MAPLPQSEITNPQPSLISGPGTTSSSIPTVEEVCMDALSMQALQILVETCCDGDGPQQKRALGLFLRRISEIQPPKRRPRLLLGVMAWAIEQAAAAQGRRPATAGEDLPEEESPQELKAALKSAPKVAKISDDELLDSLITEGGMLKLYQQGTRSFTLGQKWKGQHLPTYMETWKLAFRRHRIIAPDPAVQIVGGRMVISLSFGDMPGISAPSAPVGRG